MERTPDMYVTDCHPDRFFELPNKTGLKCPSARPYVRLSTKSFFDFNEIWYVGRGRRLMHDGMQY